MAVAQLPLKIQSHLVYSPENFLVHTGVARILQECTTSLQTERFHVFFVQGASRSGKTHFAVKLLYLLFDQGLLPEIIEGTVFSEWATTSFSPSHCSSQNVFIVDNVQDYFKQIASPASGRFVDFVETLRLKKAGLVLLSTKDPEEFQVDEHIKSRLRPGQGFLLGQPSEEDLSALVQCMAKQRGILLSERKIQFLGRRITRDIPAIERYLDKLHKLSQEHGRPATLALLGELVGEGS